MPQRGLGVVGHVLQHVRGLLRSCSARGRVQKGSSLLYHATYCYSYRPSAKMAAPPDTGMSHLGFR